MRSLNFLLVLVLISALTACGDDGGDPADPPTPNNDPNNADPDPNPDMAPVPVPDMNPDPTPEPTGCQSDGDCFGGMRCTSDGTCRARFDRGCAGDEDCRSSEVCQEVGGARACVRQDTPIVACPGAEGCGDAEGPMMAGASRRVLTPMGFEQPLPEFMERELFVGDPDIIDGEVTFYDCGLDQLCEGDPGYPGPDFGEGDGHMQGAWLAGFDHSRPALRYCPEADEGRCPLDQPWIGQFAHDDIFVRAVAFSRGQTTVAFAVIDTVGYFYDESLKVQAMLAERGVEIDLLVTSATHNHEGPDTMGQWGPGALGSDLPINSGSERWWLDYVNGVVAEAIAEAVEGMRPAVIRAGMGDTGIKGLGVQDSRDPWIFDDDMAVLSVRDAGDDSVIATVVNWGNHAEALSDGNQWITADYPGAACKYIEEGMPEVTGEGDEVIAEAIEGAGGVAVFLMGAVGGLITPLRSAVATDRQGNDWRSGNYEMSEAMGQQLATRALQLAQEAPVLEDPALSFATLEYTIPIENLQFHTAFYGLNLFDRDIYNATTDVPLGGDNQPAGLTRTSIVRLGAATLFTVPGEIFPEMLVGGYDPEVEYEFTPVVGDDTRVECDATLLPFTCESHGDCPDDWACDGGLGTCRPLARSCGGDNPCSEGADCTEGTCRRGCAQDGDCAAGFACNGEACAYSPALALGEGAAHPCLVRPSNENPPDLSAAPEGPYLKEKMPGEVIFVVGLGHDELGYIVPSYDFELAPDGAYIIEADGHHYEETNSTGPSHTLLIQAKLDALLDNMDP